MCVWASSIHLFLRTQTTWIRPRADKEKKKSYDFGASVYTYIGG
jgi:hypothetical protein